MEGQNQHLEDQQDEPTDLESVQKESLEDLPSQPPLDAVPDILRDASHIAFDPDGSQEQFHHDAASKPLESDPDDPLVRTVNDVEADLFPPRRDPHPDSHARTAPSHAPSAQTHPSPHAMQPASMTSPSPDERGKPTAQARKPSLPDRRRPSAGIVRLASPPPPDGVEITTLGRNGLRYAIGPVFNAENLSTREEHARFRHRNRVSANYLGPLYVSEDIHVACHACGGPVDPISRVPVGPFFFHLHCVRCVLCARTGVTEPFQAVQGEPVCGACLAKGFAPCVGKEKGRRGERELSGKLKRRKAGGSRGGNRKGSGLERESAYPGATRPTTAAAPSRVGEEALPVLNRAMMQGATAPSLSIGPLHNRRNTSRRSFMLMQRQQYYTQSDLNLIAAKELMNMPEERSNRRGSKRIGFKGGTALPGTGMRATAGIEDEFPLLE
ncbi:unnamed protein product [Phytomonas sp. EM1]|nr:unnamed protein product [Phytomonas sp. EM1]|eukprot:CCW63670.1 unnamed protein product [Phytomonas sp. isolate EM1]